MITLRRNDKIIILVGVVILLAAGAGVALYSPTVSHTPTPQPQQPPSGTFPVSWIVKNATLPSISDTAAKNVPFSVNRSLGQGFIKAISFRLSWVDNHAFLRRFGLDTLTLDVTTPDGKSFTASMKSQPRTKAGDFTVYDNVSSTAPPITSINGTDLSTARSNLERISKSMPWASKDINMTVTVTIGEHFPFRFLDKGNAFTLDVNYTYYAPNFGSNMSQTGSDDIPSDLPADNTEPWTPPYMSMIIQTGCGRYV